MGSDRVTEFTSNASASEMEEMSRATRNFGNDLQRQRRELDANIASLEKLMALGSRFSGSKTGGMTPAFEDLSAAGRAASEMLTGIIGTMGGVGSQLPGVGKTLQSVFGTMELGVNVTATLADGFLIAAEESLKFADAMSAEMREVDKTMFDFGKQMGGTIEEAKAFGDTMKAQTDTEFARSLYITMDAMQEFTKAASSTSLSQDQLNQTIDTGVGSANLYAVAAAQAGAMNISVGEAATLYNTAMNIQGKSAQDAAEMLGMFSGVAGTVGLTAAKVATTLNGAVQGFEKLGLSADFGRPILEGFGRTMGDMGLGIENAIGLTQSLSKALAGLTTDYANAYLVFQRGGLDIGGGGGAGVLGASIGLQAAMLEAEKTGDQSEIASQLTMGLRDTLASFTGGDIVTVQDAAESPEMQNQFYIQQQMLKTQFGVGDDASATRILDMLSRLDDATRSGDMDAKQQLEAQLQNEMEGKDQTLDLAEKANQELAIQSNLLALSQREQAEMNRNIGEWLLAEGINPAIQEGGQGARMMAEGGNAAFDRLVKALPDDIKALIRSEMRVVAQAGTNVLGKEDMGLAAGGTLSGNTVAMSMLSGMSEEERSKFGAATGESAETSALRRMEDHDNDSSTPMRVRADYMAAIKKSASHVAQGTDKRTLQESGMTRQDLYELLVQQAEENAKAGTTVQIKLSPAASALVQGAQDRSLQEQSRALGVRTTSASGTGGSPP